MTFELPSYLTSDAVPEKRTADEQNQPPSFQQAQEFVRRLDESSSCDQKVEDEQSRDSNKPQSSAEETSGKKESSSKKKSKKSDGKSSKRPSHTNIVNISHARDFNLSNYTIITNYMNGAGTSHKSNQDAMQNQRTNTQQRSNLPIPDQVFRCLDRVSEEDCRIVSEFVKCDWKALSEQLFEPNLSSLKDFMTPTERNSRKEAVRLILIRWKQVNGKIADVRHLCLALQKLDETEALIRLANRHGIK